MSNGLPPPVIPTCCELLPAVATGDVELELELELVCVLVVLVSNVVELDFADVDFEVDSEVLLELELALSCVLVVLSLGLVLAATVSLTDVVPAAVVDAAVPPPVSNPQSHLSASPTKKCPITVSPPACWPLHFVWMLLVRAARSLKQDWEHWPAPPMPRSMSLLQLGTFVLYAAIQSWVKPTMGCICCIDIWAQLSGTRDSMMRVGRL